MPQFIIVADLWVIHDASRQNNSLGILKNSLENDYYDNELLEDIAQWQLASKQCKTRNSMKIERCVRYIRHPILLVKIIKVG